MKIAYAGFDLFYPMLESLYENGCEIVKIFSNKVDNVTEFNQKVTNFAHAHDIPITYDRITLEDLVSLKNDGVKALFCAAYYYRMPILEDFKMINVHPSLLPSGRGSWPMPIAILESYDKSGVTFHKMEEDFDTGEIILQKEFELSPDENLESFMEKAYSLLPNMVSELLSNFENLYQNATAQGQGEYLSAPDENDYIIDENTDFETADRILRAFYGFDVLYFDGEKTHRLLKALAVKGKNEGEKYKINGGYLKVSQTD